MNLLALEALRAFIEGGSVAQAALRIHRTEPQVSRLLNSLEHEAGFPILVKQGRHLTITEEGRDYYRRAAILLEAADELSGYSKRTRTQRQHYVRVVAAPHIADGILADALSAVSRAHPDFRASIDARSHPDIDAVLGSSRFDLGVMQLPIDHPRVDIHELGRSRAVVVMRADNPLASLRSISVSRLLEQPVIHMFRGSLVRQRYEAEFGPIQEGRHFEVSSGPIAARLAAMGVGVTLADPFSALSQIVAGAVIRQFEFEIPLIYGYAVPKARPTSPATDRLVAGLRTSIKNCNDAIAELLAST